MWILSKNKQKLIDASVVMIQNGNDIVAIAQNGTQVQIGNYDSLNECLSIIENMQKMVSTNDHDVFVMPKSIKKSIIEGL